MATKTTDRQASTVFYAWQSDSPEKQNRYFIRAAVETAIKRLASGGKSSPTLKYDESTRDVPGSPMIVDAILGKIDACEVFVGDLSIINPHEQGGRRFPNPNVAFEAGWAAARLGWERVLLIFNTATGSFEQDVPFDLRGRRLVSYHCDASTPDVGAARERLASALVGHLRSALASPPPRRARAASKRASGLSADQERQRDRGTLHELLGVLDTEWVDAFLDALADEHILNDAEARLQLFASVARAARFHLFDRRTGKAVRDFADAWDRVHDVTLYGDATPGNQRFARFRPEFYMRGAEITKTRREFHAAREEMGARFRALTARLHESFPEFDLKESDERARKLFEKR